MIQPWPQHGAQTLTPWRGGHDYHQGQGKSPVRWKVQGSNVSFFRDKAQAWLDFCWRGQESSLWKLSVPYLHISAQLIPEGLWAAERERPVPATCSSGQRWASPRVSPPPLSAGPREDPRCLPGDWDLATLVLSFSCIDPSAFNMGELCRASSSAQLPASLENMKAWYPHPPLKSAWDKPKQSGQNFFWKCEKSGVGPIDNWTRR